MKIINKKFPKQFIKKGKFKLHSGDIVDTFYDVNEMLTDNKLLCDIVEEVLDMAGGNVVVGIATGGAIIASQKISWAMIKDGQLKGKVVGEYMLVDDVCTTENSINEAIKIIGKKPKAIFVVVDRRKIKTLDIQSLYQIE